MYPVQPNKLLLLTAALAINAAAALSQTPDSLIASGDSLVSRFDNEAALQRFKEAHALDSSNCAALWKIADTYINLGEEASKEVRPQYFYTAEKWARRALEVCPDTPNAHFVVAISSGQLALYEGGKQKIRRSIEVKEEAENTLALDPDHHGAYHVLGRWHRELANLNWVLKTLAKIVYGGVPPGASNDLALANFRKAIEIEPAWIGHYKELALTYLEIDEKEKARQTLERGLSLPNKDHQDRFHKKEMRKLLDQLK